MSPASARSASGSSSFPPPAATPEQAASLRADLVDFDWGVKAVAVLLGEVADAALRREIRLSALRAVRAAPAVGPVPSPVAVLTALPMLGELVPAIALDAALPRIVAAGITVVGLVGEPDEPGCVRVLIDLRSHEAVDDAGEVRWRAASDLGELATGRALASDHAPGVGGVGLTLVGLTLRTRVGTALGLGCGYGIQTLYLLRHAEHVVTTDISARVLVFTAFNAALVGASVIGALGVAPGVDAASESDAEPGPASDPDRLELPRGSLLEPMAGYRPDLIASNPPSVLTPPAVCEAGLSFMEYRDVGGPTLSGPVAGLAEHLEPGATAVMPDNWERRGAGSWREVATVWIPKGLDARILERELQDPVKYATMWLRDGGLVPERDPEAPDAVLEAWIDDSEVRDMRGVDFGYLIVHRPRRPREPWRLLEEVTTSGQGALDPHIAEVLEVRERLAGFNDGAVADLCSLLAPDVAKEHHLIPGVAEPTVILLRQGGGLGRILQAFTAVAALAGVVDGELSVGQTASTVAAPNELSAADALTLCVEMVEATRHLLTAGFLRPEK